MAPHATTHAIFGVEEIPNANHIRNLLDCVPPEHFDAVFHDLPADTLECGGLERMQRLDGRPPLSERGNSASRA